MTSLVDPASARTKVSHTCFKQCATGTTNFAARPHPCSAYREALRLLFAQEVYGKLEEPDGLAGLSKLRSGGMKLSDQVLAAEKAGSWSEALGLHEQVGNARKQISTFANMLQSPCHIAG